MKCCWMLALLVASLPNLNRAFALESTPTTATNTWPAAF